MKERKIYIDWLRVFACLSVILIHVFTTARTDFPLHSDMQETISKVFQNLFHFAVPVFFMITGYLFLSKDGEMSFANFFKKYVVKYIIAIFTFGYGYAILEEIFNKNNELTVPIVALINTLQGKTWAHMWYLYALVGVMLLMPIIKRLKEHRESNVKYIGIILLVSSFIVPLIETFFDVKIGFDLIIKSPYLLYAIIGYYLGNSKLELKPGKYIIGLVLSAVIIVLIEIINIFCPNMYTEKLSSLGNYDSLIVLVLSICIFVLFKKIKFNNKIISFISNNTYGIYLIHMLWINIIYKFFKFNIYENYLVVRCLLVYIAVFIASLITTYIIKKLPLIKKIV